MQNPYLIQRAKFENRQGKTGIDSILRFDYMGSSEFEWGALPASLKRVREDISNYIQFNYSFTKFPSKVVTVFCKKEHCDLKDYVNPNPDFGKINPSDFWWDIDNDYFFWKMTPEFDVKFKNALNNK